MSETKELIVLIENSIFQLLDSREHMLRVERKLTPAQKATFIPALRTALRAVRMIRSEFGEDNATE